MSEYNVNDVPIENIQLASRSSRFWAVVIDGIINMLLTFLIAYLNGWLDKMTGVQKFEPLEILQLQLYTTIGFFLTHSYFIYKNGQTFGKWVFDISIVKLDGTKAPFWSIIIKRYLSISLLCLIPLLGKVFLWINILFIFRKDRRCIHDYLAGTQVIQLEESSDISKQEIQV